ncbi:MAG TPA: ASKHA domain-containing protein [Spirochaetia bacterium]|nr:ASKHA domain-containing protein [Spirochaetia bacterium]
MPEIRIDPLGKKIIAEPGLSLREVLRRAGILLDYPCGGKGTCRQCRVSLDPAPRGGRGKLSESESAGGVRLACQVVVETDCTVTIPEERLSARDWKAGLREEEISGAAEGSLRRLRVTLPEPSLEDQRPDWERLTAALGREGVSAARPDARFLEHISAVLRETGWSADAICDENQLLWMDGGEGGAAGLAVDLGTTTVDVALVDLEKGALLGRRALLNQQVAFGADVISRAQSFHEDRGPVRAAGLRTIEEGARALLADAGVSASRIVKTVVVGNPIMIHILHGMDPWQLTRLPYIPLASNALSADPRELGWAFQEHGVVETLPLVSAYVGADTVGMILALDLDTEDSTSLSIDIGTNGEMVIARHGELLATSTAAGPAFEGAQISCGMRALPGAVTAATVSWDGAVSLQVVGDIPPRGICGTGLVSAVAQLLEREVLDATGRLVDQSEAPTPGLGARIFPLGSEPAFALSDDRKVYVSQKDIRTLQLAKGAVRTGIDTLLELTGLAEDGLSAVRLAGNFGAGLDAGAAMRIGLIPPMDLAKVHVVGNAALRGAIRALLSRPCFRRSEEAARRTRFVELGGKPEFQNRFMEAMLF